MVTRFTFNSQFVLEGLPSGDRKLLKKGMTNKKYRKNQPIFTEGTLLASVY